MEAFVILTMTVHDQPLYASSLDRVGLVIPVIPWFVT